MVSAHCTGGIGIISTEGSSPGSLYLQPVAHSSIVFFRNTLEGTTQEAKIYGFRTGDASRSLNIGVGVDAADTASFNGVSNYLFDGVILTPSGGLSTNWVTNSLSMGHDSSTHVSFIQSGDTAGTQLDLNPQGGYVGILTGLKYNVTTVNAATYDLLVDDLIVHVTYTGTGAVTSLTLPTAQALSGRFIIIKDAGGNASANNITMDTQGGETIDGGATLVMSTDYGVVQLYSDGSDWFVAN